MSRFEYKDREIRVNRFGGPKVPEDLVVRADELAADGWELDKAIPIRASACLPLLGQCTETVLLFLLREREASNG